MIIYHGSENVIYSPAFGAGNSNNDYGKGFYCTESIELSKEWACKRDRDGFSNCYELNVEELKICNLNDDYNILNWLALLTKYRGYWQRKSIAEEAKEFLQKNYLIDVSEFDVIRGYRADNSYFSFVQDFIRGTISLQKLSTAMRLGNLNDQIVLKSKKSFAHLKFVSYEKAEAAIYFAKMSERDKQARWHYQEIRPATSILEEIYILDIMRGGVPDDKLRL